MKYTCRYTHTKNATVVGHSGQRLSKGRHTMEELKSCPFCGSMPQLCYCDASGSTYTKNPATIYYGKRMTHKAYVCIKCGIRTKPYATDKGVWKAWNRRAAPIAPEEYDGAFYCGACHETINSGDKYCHECGKAVKWDG